MTIFDQIDEIKKLTSNNFNFDEFSMIDFINSNFIRNFKRFKMFKYNKINLKIKNIEIYTILNFETKINLINNIFIKNFKLISFNVFNCDAIILNNNKFKFYNVYFVQLKISNENDTNRFFNKNFLKIDLN